MRLGFIGCGNMAKAMIKGIIKNNIVKEDKIIASTLTEKSMENVKESLNINATTDNKKVAKDSDIVVLAVKPQYYEQTIKEIRDSIKEDQIIVTIAPGKTLKWIEEKFEKKVKVIRTMPNTPAMVLEGMTAVCHNEYTTKEELENVCDVLRGFGKVEVISEHLMDVVVSTSGSSPAYIFMLIEAMADGAVSGGMSRPTAYKFAAQAVLGSAKMVLETNMHPGELKDMVCSPGGTTIQAVRTLEEKGFRSAIIEAMKVCEEKSSKM